MLNMELIPADTVVMMIDFQEKLMAVMANKESIYRQANLVLAAAGQLKLPVIVTEQYPRGLGSTVNDVKTYLPAEAYYVEKNSFCAYTPEVAAWLEQTGRPTILLMGTETHICMYQTARALVARGFNVHVVMDAACSRTDDNYERGLDLMRQAGVVINNAESIVYDLLKVSGTPEFKALLPLIK